MKRTLEDNAYTKINLLLNYEFYDGGRKDPTIVAVGPDGITRSMLRAYAYGAWRENAVHFAKGLADIIADDECRFAFFPYEEENSADSIHKIRLDFHSMQDYGHFIAGEKNE